MTANVVRATELSGRTATISDLTNGYNVIALGSLSTDVEFHQRPVSPWRHCPHPRSFANTNISRAGVCVLTKGGTRALRDLDLFRPDRDAFACTLTTLSADFSLKWERNAPLPADRIAALKSFYQAGIFTWVSLEPTLDIESSLAIVRVTHEFVDLYKVGRANYCGALTKTTDWRSYTLRMIELLNKLGKAHYIEKSLQEHLPDGYHNPLRIAQLHSGSS